jgi:hypothetical protein
MFFGLLRLKPKKNNSIYIKFYILNTGLDWVAFFYCKKILNNLFILNFRRNQKQILEWKLIIKQ